MKKALKALSLLLILCLFCSCSRVTEANSNELKNRLIILALGIDKEKDGELNISVQALNTDVSSNASSESTPESMVKYYSQKGKSLFEAINKLSDLTGKQPLLSQNRIVVFGWDIANEGISDCLDDFVRNTENRTSVLVAVAQGKAQEVVFAKAGENVIPARMAEQIIERSAEQSSGLSTRVYELVNRIIDEKCNATVPLIKLKEEEKESKFLADNVAVFKKDRLIAVKNNNVAVGILFVRNQINQGVIPAEFDNKSVALTILKSKTRTKTEIVNGKPRFIINIETSVSLSEINNKLTDKNTQSDFLKIEKAAEEKIKFYVENSINECIIKSGSDVFCYGKRLKRTQPKYFKSNITNWSEDMKNAEYYVGVKVDLKGIGDSAAVLYG